MLEKTSPNTPKNVLVVAAHPDDIEFTIAGTVAKWVSEGSHVTYVICTSGETGSHDIDMPPEKLGPIRQAEQRAAAEILGVETIVFLDYPDGTLEPTLELRKDITKLIRKYKPDAILTWDPTRRLVGNSYINHPDHIALGEATLAAIMPACDSPFIFPELLNEEGLQPYKVHEVYLFGAEHHNVWIDITETIEDKIATLKCHESQMGGWKELPEYIKSSAQRIGEPHNLKYAEAYRYFFLS